MRSASNPAIRRSSVDRPQSPAVPEPSRVDVSGDWPVIDGNFEFDDMHFLDQDRWDSLSTDDKRAIRRWLHAAGRVLRPHEHGVVHTRKPHALEPVENAPMFRDIAFTSDAVRHCEEVQISVADCRSFEEAVQKFREWLEDVVACGLARKHEK